MDKVTVNALSDVSLKVKRGEFIALMGPSGAGKTTLLNLIGGLDRPTSGTIYVKDLELSSLNERELTEFRLKEVGFVFQNYNLIPVLTALENVQLPTIAAGLPGEEGRRRAIELLERVGLGGRLHHRPTELSGGEQQRVAIARALVNNPSILLADEITGNLDTKTAYSILDLLKELNKERELTIIAATHDPEVAKTAQKIVRMRDGRIIDQTK
ncbi:ABC transporter ATP-binding protein [Candidatus Bathyarchaeota archaeon]|nr:MAG: ABC transporter ATP-binding protein [Candidatus Bathyarchaeota archaeon]RLI33763.1 MAG: ABC transporter ATP-binding protein [Candidatus Bathyarchaeota archaeon]